MVWGHGYPGQWPWAEGWRAFGAENGYAPIVGHFPRETKGVPGGKAAQEQTEETERWGCGTARHAMSEKAEFLELPYLPSITQTCSIADRNISPWIYWNLFKKHIPALQPLNAGM